MDYMWERYQRQLGLVYQERLGRLRVLFVGDDPALSSALICFALLGAGASGDGGLLIFRRPRAAEVTPADVQAQCLLTTEDVGDDYEFALQDRLMSVNRDARCAFVSDETIGVPPDLVIVLGSAGPWRGPGRRVIYARTGAVALAFGQASTCLIRAVCDAGEPNILTAALASLLGALLAQEALRICDLLRPIPIERFWLTANLRLSPTARLAQAPITTLGGFSTGGMPDMLAGDDGRAGADRGQVFRAVLPFQHDLTRLLWAAFAFDMPTAPDRHSHPAHDMFFYSPYARWRAPTSTEEAVAYPDGVNAPEVPRTARSRHLLIGGAGGLGSWLLMALAASPLAAAITIIESDAAVERHNLNRQILYRERDVGRPKGEAIAAAVRAINPTLHIAIDTEHLTWDRRRRLDPLLMETDLVFTGFDNFAARDVLGVAAACAGVPLVNGGALVFDGNVELLRPEREGCIECCWEAEAGLAAAAAMRQSEEHASCTREDNLVGEIGTAIVTTNAIVGSLQALIGLAALAAPTLAPDYLDHKVQVYARDNVLARCRVPRLAADGRCFIHQHRPTHADHLLRYLAEDSEPVGIVRTPLHAEQ